MADETTPAIGMSVGATTLAAVTAERAVTRRPVLTLYPNRSPQVGIPAENPSLGETGLAITDFVDQVGAQEAVIATDGSAHRGEQLLADALRALAYTATEGRPLPFAVAVTHPAHWPKTAVDALEAAFDRVPEWSQHPAALLSDTTGVLTALHANPGLPTDGIITVCDFGGSGTNITLVDAAQRHQPINETVRHTGFSGGLIDQMLLDHVVADLGAEGALDGNLAIGSLARLRECCRNAKEQLSSNTVTELPIDIPGFHRAVWITRAELDAAIRQSFEGFLTVVEKALDRNNIQEADLAAVVSVGGGANIPAITTGLSHHLGAVVISSPRPQLTPAIGAALGVMGGAAKTAVTATTRVTTGPIATATTTATAPTEPIPASVSSPAHIERPAPLATTSARTPIPSGEPPRPIEHQPFPGQGGQGGAAWRRRPLPVILGMAMAVLIAGIVAVIALRHAANTEPMQQTVTSTPAAPTTGRPVSPMSPVPIPGVETAFPEEPPPAQPENPETAVAP